jgi:hypothetical protein
MMLIASIFIFACLEVEHVSGCQEPTHQWLYPWLPLAMILATLLVIFTLPLTISLFCDKDRHD